ncbi:MAG: DUF2064 domain-containing protein [Alphaproteobacteria bacterium]|nr:DUF2064 domain-containing protein [Alphaproteobacteria bacterium]MCB9690539.1 DUF2064 domain-containing protein [Alphaproteobacteria bacterium]
MTVSVFVFAKPPRPGVSKTRLAAGVGEEAAARLAAAFLVDTVRAVVANGYRATIATTEVDADFGVDVPRVPQGGGTLGDRLERVLAAGLRDAEVVVALGADSPGMPAAALEAAVRAARSGGVGLVPAEDGGFTALATSVVPPGVFDDLPWSSPDTLEATQASLVARGLFVHLGEPWFDIDHPEDLERFRGSVARGDAPATWAVLDRLP